MKEYDLIFKNGWVYINAFFYGFWIKECEFNKYKKSLTRENIKSK
tara:strand:- start:2708 stop:2842 length:135 start_codon:yes stop_codon:yes gene_type:complete